MEKNYTQIYEFVSAQTRDAEDIWDYSMDKSSTIQNYTILYNTIQYKAVQNSKYNTIQ